MSTKEFSKAIGIRTINGFSFEVYSGLAHRGVLVIRGSELSENIHAHSSLVSDTDPHKAGPHKKDAKILRPQPLDGSRAAIDTAKALWEYQLEVNKFLNTLPLNEERIKKGLLSVNFLLTRGAGTFFKVPSFKEKYNLRAACIAGAPLYIGISRYLGMDVIGVKGATGLANTNVKGKVLAAKKALKNHDFVYLHFKATDTAAEETGNYLEKKHLIEKIDKELKAFKKLKNTVIFISGDHTTACEVKDHVEDPVPFLIYDGKNRDSIAEFGETSCRFGSLKHLRGEEIFETVLKKSGRKQINV
jgi:2,3-bisphosphoglycerate-independent phosphoglycerate mutase